MESNKEVLATINELLYDEDVLEVLNNEPDREKEEQMRKDYLSLEEKPIEVRQRENEYVNRMFDKFDHYLKMYKHSRNKVIVNDWNDKIMQLIDILISEREHFTDKQWDIIARKTDEWVSATQSKEKYFAMKSGDYVPSEHCEESSNSSDEFLLKGKGEAAAPPKKKVVDEDNEMILRAYWSDEELKKAGININNTENTEEHGQLQ